MGSDSDSSLLTESDRNLLCAIFADTDSDEEEFTGFVEGVDFIVQRDNSSSSKATSSELMFSSPDDESMDDVDSPRHQAILAIIQQSSDDDFDSFTQEDIQEPELHSKKSKGFELTYLRFPANGSEVAPKPPETNGISSSESKKSDFDIMVENRKKVRDSNKKTSRKIYECEDVILNVIDQMKAAAEEDKRLHMKNMMATKKLKTLQNVLPQLKKEDLKVHFCDMGLLDVVADWLTPTSDNILPNMNIRNELIHLLCDFTCITKEHLRRSQLAPVLRRLVRHAHETRDNKEKLRRLLSSWYLSVFNLKDDYHSLTPQEREKVVKIRNKKRYYQESPTQNRPNYSPNLLIQKKPKESFEKMLAKPDHTKAIQQKLKRFGLSKFQKPYNKSSKLNKK